MVGFFSNVTVACRCMKGSCIPNFSLIGQKLGKLSHVFTFENCSKDHHQQCRCIPTIKKNRAHKIHFWKVLCMIIASNTSFGSKKVTDTACTTLGSGQHGLCANVHKFIDSFWGPLWGPLWDCLPQMAVVVLEL